MELSLRFPARILNLKGQREGFNTSRCYRPLEKCDLSDFRIKWDLCSKLYTNYKKTITKHSCFIHLSERIIHKSRYVEILLNNYSWQNFCEYKKTKEKNEFSYFRYFANVISSCHQSVKQRERKLGKRNSWLKIQFSNVAMFKWALTAGEASRFK